MADPVQDTGKPTKVSTKPGDCGFVKRLFSKECNAPKPAVAAPRQGDLEAGGATINQVRTGTGITADQKAAQLVGL